MRRTRGGAAQAVAAQVAAPVARQAAPVAAPARAAASKGTVGAASFYSEQTMWQLAVVCRSFTLIAASCW